MAPPSAPWRLGRFAGPGGVTPLGPTHVGRRGRSGDRGVTMTDTASAPGQGDAQAMRGWLATRPQPVRALVLAPPTLAASVARALNHGGYLTRTVPDGEEARA